LTLTFLVLSAMIRARPRHQRSIHPYAEMNTALKETRKMAGAGGESERNGKAPGDSCIPRSLTVTLAFYRLIH
jgi:hypothetical protein